MRRWKTSLRGMTTCGCSTLKRMMLFWLHHVTAMVSMEYTDNWNMRQEVWLTCILRKSDGDWRTRYKETKAGEERWGRWMFLITGQMLQVKQFLADYFALYLPCQVWPARPLYPGLPRRCKTKERQVLPPLQSTGPLGKGLSHRRRSVKDHHHLLHPFYHQEVSSRAWIASSVARQGTGEAGDHESWFFI